MFDLSKKEIDLSKAASKELGIRVIVYKDGNWMVDAIYQNQYKMGFGDTVDEAIKNFKERNDLET